MYFNIDLSPSFDVIMCCVTVKPEYIPISKDKIHITVFYGNDPSEEMHKFLFENIGKEFSFVMEAIGYNDGAVAVRVKPQNSGFITNSKFPHITVGVKAGHKPVESNEITEWHEIEPRIISGILQRVH